MNSGPETVGIDIGGVVIGKSGERTDTSFFGGNYLTTPAIAGVFEAVGQLVRERFGEHVWLVSKCGPRVERKSREWLAHHRFFERTGVGPDHLRFCRERREKAGICTDLGTTHFVDDRLEVLGYLRDVPHLYLFRPNPAEVKKHRRHLPRVHEVDGWEAVLRDLCP